MTTDYAEQMNAQIERFEKMRTEHGDDFGEEVLLELVDLSYTHSFEAELVEDPRILAVADVGFDGSIKRVQIVTAGEVPVETIDVASGTALWAAMEAWLADMRKKVGS